MRPDKGEVSYKPPKRGTHGTTPANVSLVLGGIFRYPVIETIELFFHYIAVGVICSFRGRSGLGFLVCSLTSRCAISKECLRIEHLGWKLD